MKARLEVIYWQDSSSGGGPAEPKDIDTIFPILSAGQFVKEDKRTVTLALESFQATGDHRVRDYLSIPKVNIVSRQSLTVQVREEAMKHGAHKPMHKMPSGHKMPGAAHKKKGGKRRK